MNPQLHLSDAELYEELDWPEGLAAEEHLANCAECRTQVDAIRASLIGLQRSASGMAEAEFRPRLQIPQAPAWGRVHAWPLSVAAAAILFAASLTLAHRPESVGTAERTTTQAVAESSPDTDNALLDGIDRDLSTSVAPSLAPLDVSATEGGESAAKLN